MMELAQSLCLTAKSCLPEHHRPPVSKARWGFVIAVALVRVGFLSFLCPHWRSVGLTERS